MTNSIRFNNLLKLYKHNDYEYFNYFKNNFKKDYYWLKNNNLLYDFKYKLFGEHFDCNLSLYSFNDGNELVLGTIANDKVNTLNKDLVLYNHTNIEDYKCKFLITDMEYYFTDTMLSFYKDYYKCEFDVSICNLYETGTKKQARIFYESYNYNLERLKNEKYKYYSTIINNDWDIEFNIKKYIYS